MRSLTPGITLAFVLAAPGIAFGQGADTVDSMRCGTKLVLPGDTEYDVLSKCGEPTFRDNNRWTYDEGSDALVKTLTFLGGKLSIINIEERD